MVVFNPSRHGSIKSKVIPSPKKNVNKHNKNQNLVLSKQVLLVRIWDRKSIQLLFKEHEMEIVSSASVETVESSCGMSSALAATAPVVCLSSSAEELRAPHGWRWYEMVYYGNTNHPEISSQHDFKGNTLHYQLLLRLCCESQRQRGNKNSNRSTCWLQTEPSTQLGFCVDWWIPIPWIFWPRSGWFKTLAKET